MDLAESDLRSLSQVWSEQQSALERADALRTFNEQLQREWAIETGVIERLYSLDRGVTQLLIERGIDATLIPRQSTDRPPEIVAAMIKDHETAVEFLFAFVKQERRLSTSYIKELHALLTRHQSTAMAVDSLGRLVEVLLVRGDYKPLPNNPTRPNGLVHEYCPPEHVAAEMDRLVAVHLQNEAGGVPPEVSAAWLHHRFSQIHPFQDGNGRVARCLATLVFIRAAWFPLVVTRDDRDRYIAALERADASDLSDLVRLFAAVQKQALVRALGISGQVLTPGRPEQVIGAAREQFVRRERAIRAEWDRARELARIVQRIATERLREIAADLGREVGEFFRHSRFQVDEESSDGSRGHYFRWQIIETARRLRYFANTREYRAWTRLLLRTEAQSEILVSFHATGHEFRGLIVAAACLFRREETDDGDREVVDLTPLSDEIFVINYRESREQLELRFRKWFEEALTRGLETWRRGL